MPDQPWEVVEAAIALDVSGTIQPLLLAARLTPWELVNDLSLVEPTPNSAGGAADLRQPAR